MGRLCRGVGIQLVRAEAARGGQNPEGRTVFGQLIRAKALLSDARPKSVLKAVALFRHALEPDDR
jgi:hypothetical protein